MVGWRMTPLEWQASTHHQSSMTYSCSSRLLIFKVYNIQIFTMPQISVGVFPAIWEMVSLFIFQRLCNLGVVLCDYSWVTNFGSFVMPSFLTMAQTVIVFVFPSYWWVTSVIVVALSVYYMLSCFVTLVFQRYRFFECCNITYFVTMVTGAMFGSLRGGMSVCWILAGWCTMIIILIHYFRSRQFEATLRFTVVGSIPCYQLPRVQCYASVLQ